mmetsp:Transcript_46468/g.109203  ORF Transcript_46468/g.109203 Transcript_46468/m.109203 type:complete len:133 (-) Transcript_46468:18-416(-)
MDDAYRNPLTTRVFARGTTSFSTIQAGALAGSTLTTGLLLANAYDMPRFGTNCTPAGTNDMFPTITIPGRAGAGVVATAVVGGDVVVPSEVKFSRTIAVVVSWTEVVVVIAVVLVVGTMAGGKGNKALAGVL